ncbi:MAG: class I SAM-dependent methyltransferase [Candidatus Microthrix sp.]|nr:class I SAM-dependent methyltransferase [Candidatus Microthrix sp.]
MSTTSDWLAAGLARTIAGRVSTGTLHLTTPDGTRSTHRGAASGPEATLIAHDLTFRPPAGGRRARRAGAGYVTVGGTPTTCRPSSGWPLRRSDRTNAGPAPRRCSVWVGRCGIGAPGVAAVPSTRCMATTSNLGNRFYEQWLDPSVTYSSGFYDGTDDLAEAQRANHDRVLNRAGTYLPAPTC